MKRLVLIFAFLLLPVIPAHANTTITLAEPMHRVADGIFIDDDLASAITPQGRLGRALFDRTSAVRSYVIDMATIEEIVEKLAYPDEKKLIARSKDLIS